MSHKTNISKTAAPVMSVQLTQAEASGTLGQALANTRIYVVDANGAPTGDILESGVAGSVPTSGSGGSPSIVPLWTPTTALDAGAQVRATVAIGGFVVGEYISSNTSRTTGATFNSSEATFFTSVPEDTTIVKKSEVVNVLTSTATDVPISAAQAKVLQDTKLAIAGHTAASIVGRAANASGDAADIAATADNTVLRRASGTVSFGAVDTAMVTDKAVTHAKIQDMAALSVMGRSANSVGVVGDLATTNASNAVLRESAGTLGFGTLATANITNDAVTYAKLQNVTATDRLLGRSTAGSGDVEEIICTATARSLLDDLSTSAMLVTLGAAALATSGTPAMDGTAALGVATVAAKSDHVHPSDTSRAPTVSPTMTGTITADGTVRLGDGQNLGDNGTAIASATTIFPNVVSTNTTTIANTDTALRISRPGTGGTKWGNNFDVNIGSHTTGINALTQVDFRLNNGGVAAPDMTALTLRGDGQVLVSANPTAALGVATKQYADSLVTGLLDYRGAFTPAAASGATGYPTTGGSGTAGAVLKGDMYFASAQGFILTEAIQVGDSVVAKQDTPGQVAANWDKLNANISYVPENVASKVTAFSTPTDTQYPSAKLVSDQLALRAPASNPAFTGDATLTDTVAGLGPVFKLENNNYAAADKAQLVFEHGSTENLRGIVQSNLPGNNDVDMEFFTTDNSVLNTTPALRLTGNNTVELANALPLTQGGTGGTTAIAARTALGAQATLVSGTNIKTVGGFALPGSGDIPFPTFATSLRLMTPADIIEDTDRAIYLLADDLALGALATWSNPGTGGDFTQVTAGSQPSVVAVPALGNRRAALFANDYMEAANISLGTNYGLFAVFMLTSGGDVNQFILSEVFTGASVEYTFGTQTSNFFAGHYNGAWRQHAAGTPVVGTPYIMSASYNSANISITIDGAAATSTAQTSNPVLTEAGNIRLGRRWDGTSDIFDGHIACVVAKRNAAFTATELAQLQGWAAWHYGRVSALPVGHTYKTVPPMITA